MRLNVGGKKFETTISTLEQICFFRSLFAHSDPSTQEFFLDRDPKLFTHILRRARDPSYKVPFFARGEEAFFMPDRLASMVLQAPKEAVPQEPKEGEEGGGLNLRTPVLKSLQEEDDAPGTLPCPGALIHLVTTGRMNHLFSPEVSSPEVHQKVMTYFTTGPQEASATSLLFSLGRHHPVSAVYLRVPAGYDLEELFDIVTVDYKAFLSGGRIGDTVIQFAAGWLELHSSESRDGCIFRLVPVPLLLPKKNRDAAVRLMVKQHLANCSLEVRGSRPVPNIKLLLVEQVLERHRALAPTPIQPERLIMEIPYFFSGEATASPQGYFELNVLGDARFLLQDFSFDVRDATTLQRLSLEEFSLLFNGQLAFSIPQELHELLARRRHDKYRAGVYAHHFDAPLPNLSAFVSLGLRGKLVRKSGGSVLVRFACTCINMYLEQALCFRYT